MLIYPNLKFIIEIFFSIIIVYGCNIIYIENDIYSIYNYILLKYCFFYFYKYKKFKNNLKTFAHEQVQTKEFKS